MLKKSLFMNINRILFFILFLITLLPSFIFVSTRSSSLAKGLLIASVLICIYFRKILINVKFSKKIFVLGAFVIIYIFVFSVWNFIQYDDSKPLFSFVFLIVICASYLVSRFLLKINAESLADTLKALILFLIFLGWLTLFYKPDFLGYIKYYKAVFPFSEPSHFALVVGGLAVAYSFVGSVRFVIFISINFLILSIIYPNLTLLVFSLMVFIGIFVRLKPFAFKFLLFFILPLTGAVVLLLLQYYPYFSVRLELLSAKNLTTLVFLQGWELAYLNILNAHGLGLGFQMLGGTTTVTGNITAHIVSITENNIELNLKDGGFLAAKIIAEFGLIGLVLTLFYLLQIIQMIFKMNKLYNTIAISKIAKKQILFYGITIGFSVEFFLRGYGYFSPGVFMIFVSIFSLITLNKQAKKELK